MDKKKWYVFLTLILVLSSLTIYTVQIFLFKKPGDTFFYLFQDLAFVPVQVLLVTIVIDRLLKNREKQIRLNKMNMVVGIFFSEMGNALLQVLASMDTNQTAICHQLSGDKNWTDKYFKQARQDIAYHKFKLDASSENLHAIKEFLTNKRDCLLRLMENPSLLEHESFTDLLWAISHIFEELSYHQELRKLSTDDRKHLQNDLNRAYSNLVHEWLGYMKHLRDDYPYMFSLSIRHNPFEQNLL